MATKLNYIQTLWDVCQSRDTFYSENQKRRMLQFLKSMQTCLKDVCEFNPKKVAQYKAIEKLLQQKQINDGEFCHVINAYRLSTRIPLNDRRLQAKLEEHDLKLQDLEVFNTLQTEEEMQQQMKTIWESSKHKEAQTFEELLNILFATDIHHITREPTGKIFRVRDAFEYPILQLKTIERDFEKVTFGAIAVYMARTYRDPLSKDQAATAVSIVNTLELRLVKRDLPYPPREYAIEQLLQFLSEFIQLDAFQEMDIDRFEEITEDYLGSLFEQEQLGVGQYRKELNNRRERNEDMTYAGPLQKMVDESRINNIRMDKFWGLINDIWKYHMPILSKQTFTPVFPTFSEDFITIEALNEDKEPYAFLERWRRIKEGILQRVWKYKEDDVDKIRSLLRFFPTPYAWNAWSILPLFLSTTQCAKAITQHFLSRQEQLPKDSDCGCNCRCGTVLGTLLANEVGLLGSKIHVVSGTAHTYLAVGNRADWRSKKATIIETTHRATLDTSSGCKRQFRSILQIQTEGYNATDQLVPSYYDILLTEFIKNGSLQKNHPRVIRFLKTLLEDSDQWDTLWGFVNMWNYFGNNRGRKLNNDAMENTIFRLLEKENNHSTYLEYFIYRNKDEQDIAYIISTLVEYGDVYGLPKSYFQLLHSIAMRANVSREFRAEIAKFYSRG